MANNLQAFDPEDQAAINQAFQNPNDPLAQKIIQDYKAKTTPQYTNDNQLIQPSHTPIQIEPSSSKTSNFAEDILGGITSGADNAGNSDTGKFVRGTAVGAADVLNPLSIPHGLEKLGLAAAGKGNEKTFFQPLDTSQLKVLGKTAGRGLYGALTGDKTSIGDIYDQEMANDAALENDPAYSKGRTTGEVLGGIYSVGGLAKDILNMSPKLAAKISGNAENLAFESTKPIGQAATKVMMEDRANIIGRQMLDDGILETGKTGIGPSFKVIQTRLADKLKEYGEKIGYFVKSADKAREADSSIKGIAIDELTSRIEKEVIQPLMEDPSTMDVAKQIRSWTDNLKPAAKGETEISFAQAQKWKKSLSEKKAQFDVVKESASRNAFRQAEGILNNSIESGIDTALGKAAPELTNDFKVAKTAYRNTLDAKDFVDDNIFRLAKNKSFGITDVLALIKGLPYVVGKSLIENRGAQTAAPFLNKLATPNSAFHTLVNTAGSVNTLHNALSQ